MIPRAVKRKLPRQAAAVPTQPQPATVPTAPTSTGSTPVASTSTSRPLPAPGPPPPGPAELARLGAILISLEEGLSDWGMSTYKKNGLLEKVQEAQTNMEGCK